MTHFVSPQVRHCCAGKFALGTLILGSNFSRIHAWINHAIGLQHTDMDERGNYISQRMKVKVFDICLSIDHSNRLAGDNSEKKSWDKIALLNFSL